MFNDVIKELRLNRKLTTDDVASSIGVSGSAYRNYERGERSPSFEILVKLADFYGVTTDYLLGREPEPDPLAMLNIKVNNQKFIDIYQELPEFQQQVLVDAMRKLSASAEEEYKKKKPRMQSETTLGAIEDDALAPEEDAGA